MTQATQTFLQDLIKAHGIPRIGKDNAKVEENLLGLLSNASSGRTNQFEIKRRLEGLVEKSRIFNNDPLGDALETRLEELPLVSNDWTPEILSLLLDLSDRPVHKTKVKDLVGLRRETPSAFLTWEEFIEEDPLEDQTEIWRDIDFTRDSSDEDLDVRRKPTEVSSNEDELQALWTENPKPDLEALVVAINETALQAVSNAGSWQEVAKNLENDGAHETEAVTQITELVAIREVIFMLLGLPTSIFEEDRSGNYTLRQNVRLCSVSQDSLRNLLCSLLTLGQKLRKIRHWIKAETNVPLEQTFGSALEVRLNRFYSSLDTLQNSILKNSSATIATLLVVNNVVHNSSRLIVELHDIILALVSVDNDQRPFILLQSLYEKACSSQRDGDDEKYEFVAQVFFQCFHIYLKPILAWMETGEINTHNGITFIEELKREVLLHSLWQEKHRLVYNPEGTLNAPLFFHVAAQKILNTGKSVSFLKKLGLSTPAQKGQPDLEPLMTFEAVCLTADPRNLSPFSELFNIALAGWIASRHKSSSSYLRNQLDSRCGLQRALSSLEHVYFYRNGALSNCAVYPIFERIDRAKKRWNDALTTTEIFHSAFASADCIDLDRLSACPTVSIHDANIKPRSMDILESLSVSYLLPWPVANIIRPQSMSIYQRIFILLTQILRAKYLLQRSKLPTGASTIFYIVRANLLWLTNTLLTHLTLLVIEINTVQMRYDIGTAEDVDAMIAVHAAYIARLEDQCFLTKQHASLHRAVIALLDLAILFSDVQDALAEQTFATPVPMNGHFESDSSNSSSEDEGKSTKKAKPTLRSGAPPEEKLAHIHHTYTQLLAIVTAAVESISKADGGQTWEILAGNLAFAHVR